MTKALLAHQQQKGNRRLTLAHTSSKISSVFAVSLSDTITLMPTRKPNLLHLSNSLQTQETFTTILAALHKKKKTF